MALKKGMFENYIKERAVSTKDVENNQISSQYSHNRVFDEPESLKQLYSSVSTMQQENQSKVTDFGHKKTEHKVHTNLTQKPNTNLTQSEHKKYIKKTYKTQSTHKPNTKLNTAKTQSTHKVDTNITQTQHISTLIGHQRIILLFVFEACKKARSHLTDPLTIIYISKSLEIALGSIKTSIARLCEKGFLKINTYKNGRGGWSIYEIPDHVYKELLQMETQHKLHTNLTQSTHKVDTKLNTQPNTNAPSSSRYNNITTTILPEEWNFDISTYQKFGFTMTQLKQLFSLGVNPLDVEQSLIEFNYDLENNALTLSTIKTNKINYLMGLLRKGQSYVSETYRNEQEAIISEMASRAEQKRKKLLEEKFMAWETSLEHEDRKKILTKLPPTLMVLERTYGTNNLEVKKWFFDYFLQNVKEEKCLT